LTLLGVCVFMLWAAGHYTVFDDEAFSCRRYAMPHGQMVSALWHGAEPDPPLYYLLENIWVGVAGLQPLALRTPSIILFLIGLVAIRAAGQTWFDRRTGLAAMVFCALHPAHLFFGFAARWYSMMFLMTSLLLWLTARLAAADKRDRRLILCWSLVAAAACYTNYFGPVVVGLVWLIGFRRSQGKPGAAQRWIWAAAAAIVLYLPWVAPFWRQLAAPPSAGGESSLSYVALFGRTLMALLMGNLASIEAWWVWAPLSVFAIGITILTIRQWRAVWPIAIFVLGCLVVGVVSRTMIDKYVMTFSGAACLLAAAILVRNVGTVLASPARLWARAALACLVVGWTGCAVNLVTQKHWSSLRWLDPFEEVIDGLLARKDLPPPACWVMTHPSARYYFGCLSVRQVAVQAGRPSWKVGLRDWRRFADPPTGPSSDSDAACGTPSSVLDRMKRQPVPVLLTIETTGFHELAEAWDKLLAELGRSFILTQPQQYLEDPAAVLKDWLDPTVTHPRWRIVVRIWELRDRASGIGQTASSPSAP
jgi:hypothetical protein